MLDFQTPTTSESASYDPNRRLTGGRRVLVVEDEDDIQELLNFNLTREGYDVECVSSGEEAIRVLKARRFDAIVLDLMLPGIDGYEVCRRVKADPASRNAKVIMLTAKGEEVDIVNGLGTGADDYVSKPFSVRVLIARLKSHLRPVVSTEADEQVVRARDLVLESGRMEARVGEERVPLTLTEFRILMLLAQNPGWVFSRYQIVDSICGPDHVVTERSVDVQIVNIRRKLGEHARYVETVRGVGYRFISDERE